MKYETVIGLEVHAQLKTQSKIFCSCSTEFGKAPNQNTCPICLGMPGVLPVLNRRVVEYAMKACLATHCEIQPMNQFARKNYFYPDLPKGYQVSQFDLPIGLAGHLTIQTPDGPKRIGLTRIHMEEDAGKSIHGENLGEAGQSYVDYNRTGVPLIEIVSEPELRSAEDAREYLVALKSVLQYAEVSDCNMEEGSFRCDANVSLRPVGQKEFGTRVELKNINSFKFVQKAIEHEVERQTKVLNQGDPVVQETRLYDANRNLTFSMRSKEEAHDYRYFPEPDLVPIVCSAEWVESIRQTLPEMPEAKRLRFVEQYGIPEYDAGVLTTSRQLADYFEECVALFNQPKPVSNWIMGDLMRLMNLDDRDIRDCPVTPAQLAGMLKLIDAGTLSGKMAKTVFETMYKTGKEPAVIIKEQGLTQISDEGELGRIVDDIIAASPEQVEQFKAGRDKVLSYFIGQAMKASKGQANPGLLNQLFKDKLSRS
ncbi:Asp-tRNA(Asn)/Glu-tRNA(Gln) amidotransferase subunit GatB [Nitrospina watsonii]|uniref:Aspartyl/glutamyl-tRNA(Asn/Gln) amidotransferase subunit B n=1 Tax=Nitrospina watsonii TaxID=1323948 RepID=A0ABM9HCU1_9BACT|nr:Asp-tRNA(Asn)/Glu-tRNA(Gln) amidotransferase subunit GatB [Nitrospina watsonii]CAI2717883.1 Aspartyl/glutamyl-tRNA(Asn/Gln) amidotransferase subunit B [Nitrospina watsonii]